MPRNRERLLLFAFLSALAVAAGAVGWGEFSKSFRSQNAALGQRREKVKSLIHWIEGRETWQAKGHWMDGHPAPSYIGPETEAAFFQAIQESLAGSNVDIVEQKIRETKPSGRMVEVQIDLVLVSSLEHLIKWLHKTQGIDSYRAITHFKIKSDADNFKIRAEVSLVQYFAKPGA